MSKELRESIQALFAHGEKEAREILKLVTPEELDECLQAVKAVTHG